MEDAIRPKGDYAWLNDSFGADKPQAESVDARETVAVLSAVFDGVSPKVYDSHRRFCVQLGVDLGPDVWILDSQERMPFPEALLYGLAAVFASEEVQSKKADWILWIEDDVAVPPDLYTQLRAVADPVDRPVIAVAAYDRNQPFLPAVWGMKDGKLDRFGSIPDTGCIPVAQVGMTVMLMHRSLFDKIQQPWFGGGESAHLHKTEKGWDVRREIKPDMGWCAKLREAGIPIYVHFGVRVTHFGQKWPVNRETAMVMREMRPFEYGRIRSYVRGEL